MKPKRIVAQLAMAGAAIIVVLLWVYAFRNIDSIARRKRVNAELEALVIRVKNSSNDTEALSVLITDLEDSYHWKRTGAAGCIGKLGPKAKPAVPALAKALRDPDPYLRREAAFALLQIGIDAKEALPAQIAALKLGDCDAAWFSAEAIGNLGAEGRSALPALVEALDVSSFNRPYGAKYGLGPKLSFYAADALGKLQDREALPVLEARLRTTSSEFKAHLAHAIREIDPTDAESIKLLASLLNNEDVDAQIYTLQSLGGLGSNAESAIPAIKEYIDRGEFKDRAKDALGKIEGVSS